MAHKIIYQDYKAERMAEASIEIVMGDDFTLVIPPRECWPDDWHAHTGDATAMLGAICGKAEAKEFFKAGGTVLMLDHIIDSMVGKPGE